MKHIWSGLTLVLISFNSFAQTPFTETEIWKSNRRIEGPFSELVLTQIDSVHPREAYYRVEFSPNHTFRTYNIPGCGLDCIISSYGSYSMDDKTIKMTIDSTFYFKACSGDSIRTVELGTYFWVKDDYSLRLVKSLADEPKSNYFKQLQLDIPEFEEKEVNDLCRKYVYLYNRVYPLIQNNSKEKYKYLAEEIRQWKRSSYNLVYGSAGDKHEEYLALHVELVKIMDELQQPFKY